MEITIPENAGLGEYQQLLTQAENELSKINRKFIQYRIDATTAKTKRDYELAVAKVKHQNEKTPTMMNAKAACEPAVKEAQADYDKASASLILGEETVNRLKEIRDSLKCLIKSHQQSY